MISIFALIYASTAYADSVFNSLKATTPELETGDAEFFFVANNASDEVMDHLDKRDYPYFARQEELGDVPPDIARSAKYDYMIDVYRGWNWGITHSAGDVILPVNSDHVFYKGWLTELMKVWTPGKALSPVMIEPNDVRFRCKGGTGSVLGAHGKSPKEFDVDAFRSDCQRLRRQLLTKGGCYMPCMMLKQAVIDVGMFRPGNLDRRRRLYGIAGFPSDVDMFEKLKRNGIDHKTCWSSFCYHFMEGELREWRSQTSAQ